MLKVPYHAGLQVSQKTTSEMKYYLLTRMLLFPQLTVHHSMVQIQFILYWHTVLTVLTVNVYIKKHIVTYTQPFDAVNISTEN